ncbi:MAG TPA: respiratory nitrate reductase subunit gamma [Thermodesulfobacteriota bacterium]|nr:respiratory nitrate reductase subunit gamma [Thermodesulfobacteriota bacterium]
MVLSFLLGILPYITVAIFLSGILFRFWVWIRTPVPLRIVTTPGPKTRIGVAGRLIGDILWFPNLLNADQPLWVAGWCFHVLLWLVLLRHLRYFLYPVPGWIAGIQTIGLYAGYLIPIPLGFLLARRFLIDRTLYISILGDYFVLFLLLSITLSGTLLHLFFRTYLIDVKALINGLIHFKYLAPETHWLFILHFLLVMGLLVYFPFSKLVHGGGLILSPTRNQRANFEKRFINPWDFSVSYSDQNLSTPEKYREALVEAKEGERE